ncbi:MAG: AI-2E family transporter [Syntrophales bacterium]|nr:AI-2E family transporter [Syntrophales bacterium]MDD5234212.1 AI-2E family transporter [Syntrophales bacterium]MDD5531773.1 AI-2E family transporter [Syntrophales bacterium]
MTEKICYIIFFTIVTVVVVLFLYVLSPFFFPIFWAGVFAAISRPLYERMNRRKKLPHLNAGITLITVILILIIPLTIAAGLLLNESIHIYSSISEEGAGLRLTIQSYIDQIINHRVLRNLDIDPKFWTDRFYQGSEAVLKYIINSLRGWTQDLLVFLLMFAVMLYLLFYFIRDGDRIRDIFFDICPLGKDRSRSLLQHFTSTARAALKGTLILGGIQGALGGLLFWFVGIQAALVWAVVMVIAAILPVGSAIIWGPAGVILLMIGNTWQGILVLAFGTIVIGSIDNLLRPIVVGKELAMHPVLIFLSTLGGLAVFGFSGFVIGPVITSLLLAFYEMYASGHFDFSPKKP